MGASQVDWIVHAEEGVTPRGQAGRGAGDGPGDKRVLMLLREPHCACGVEGIVGLQ